jgi:phosphoglycerate dehydrogenase-like enzyme
MKVLLLAHHESNPCATAIDAQCVSMNELLSRSDFVSLHSRHTPETHHLIGREQLRRMRPDAFLINTARAAIVDPWALKEALVDGWIAGAGLDVHDPEPAALSPLIGLDNVVATPHLGNRTREGVLDVVRCSIENARQVLDGQRPEFVVNPAVYNRGG